MLAGAPQRLVAAIGGVLCPDDPRQLDERVLLARDLFDLAPTDPPAPTAWDWRGSPIATSRAPESLTASNSHACSRVEASAASS